jgi:EAL domain-containing protein (putative c-di-GMP-specific phosphodiesterase class I)/AmiR/NasT family two-component response regulator
MLCTARYKTDFWERLRWWVSNMLVLILDDEVSVANAVAATIEKIGFEAIVSTQADDFFRLYELHKPSYLVLDLLMPNMDGVEVFVELSKRKCQAKIIILSGVDNSILEAAKRSATEHSLSVLGIATKPFVFERLRSLLASDASKVELGKNQRNGFAEPIKISQNDLELALERKELFVVYQPKIVGRCGSVAGFEALVRWQHPQRGLVMPDDFIPLAESSGLINPLTDYVVDEALQWFSKHLSGTDIHLAINVSAKNLEVSSFADKLAGMCRQYDYSTNRLICELTETSMMEDTPDSLGLLTRLRLKGIQLSIDDFGTGFSSMQQLVRLPFSEVKIDKSFVLNAFDSNESLSVVKSIIELSKRLELRSSAEGVEDMESLRRLCGMGCDLLQGYFIARPMAGDLALQWLKNHDPQKYLP